MLPEILTLKNFISYREKTTLDFTKFHIALISGANGHGKSSLLDAITFSLFTMARGVEGNKKGMGDLVTNGENSLSVNFRFFQGGEHYSVTRTFDKIRNASNVLLEVERDGQFVNISENSIRETDEKIREILRMNYETFVTSSFILQGRSDYFTSMPETEKIEVLREALLLNVYEKAREKAREKIRDLQVKKEEAERSITEISEELLKKDEVIRNLKEKESIKEKIDSELEIFKSKLFKLQEDIAKREALRSKQNELQKAFERTKKSILDKENSLSYVDNSLNELCLLIDKKEKISASYTELIKAEEVFNNLFETKLKVDALKNRRNEILAKIDKERSNLIEKLKLKEKAKNDVSESIKETENEIKQIEVELNNQKNEINNLNSEIETIAKKLNELQKIYDESLKKKSIKELTLSNKLSIEKIRREREESIKKQLSEKYEELKRVLSNLEKIDLEFLESELSKKEKAYSNLLSENAEAEAKLNELKKGENEISFQISTFNRHIKEIDEKVDLLNTGEGNCPLCGSPLDEAHRSEILKDLIKERNEVEVKLEGFKISLDEIKTGISKIKLTDSQTLQERVKEVEALRGKLEQKSKEKEYLVGIEKNLKDSIYDLESYLGKLLTEEEESLLKEYTMKLNELENIEEEIEEIKRNIDDTKKINEELNTRKEKLSISISGLTARLEKDKANIVKQTKDLNEIDVEISEIKGMLASEDFIKPHKDELLEVEEKLKSIQFDETAFNEAKSKRDSLKNVRKEYEALRDAETRIESLRNNRKVLIEEIGNLKKDLEEDKKSIDNVSKELETFLNIDAMLDTTNSAIKEKEKSQKQIAEDLIRLQEALKRISEKEGEKIKKEVFIKESENNLKMLNVIDNMFSKEGIPIAVIRSVLPEIENLSNNLLMRMSNGSMQLKFNTMRDTKSGEKTTLEINVYDNGERRRYELFSGGEQFRINLAIRIGISLFLSQIAKAPLEMLVIDEGFGSQDDTGKERILSEINSIKDQFKKVLVITHMGDIKESFPYEIRVVKDAHGSKLFVV